MKSVRFSPVGSISLLAIATLTSVTAQAQVTVTTTPFTGILNETFESFPNYLDAGSHPVPDPTALFGGAASLTGNDNYIYEPSTDAIWELIDKGNADVAGGTKAIGVNGPDFTCTIVFDGTVTQFGGFFNAALGDGNDDLVTFEFRDASSALIDSMALDVDPANGTALNFFGFTANTAIKTVTITGDYVVMDSLRAHNGSAAAPEPGTLALLLPFVALVARRRKGGIE